MRIYTLDVTQQLPIDLDRAWAFFSNPRNLARITPDKLDFRITSSIPDEIYAGLIITYRIKPLLGIPVSWITEITHVEAPYRFTDEQRSGPYRFWHHTHFFRAVDGVVEMRDLVHYCPRPAGLSGLMNTLLVDRQLRGIFDYRRRILEDLFPMQDREDKHGEETRS